MEENSRKKKYDLLGPKNDVVFQTLFSQGRERITKAMLEDILKIKIQKIDLDKRKDLLNDNKEDKNGRVDIRAVINDNVECDIEMQLYTHEKMIERFLYYWAKMYTANLQIGNRYQNLRKTISIIILDDKLPEFKEIAKSHTKWQLREEEYKKKILTSFCELHIIEVPKAIEEYKRNKKDETLQWMMFLDNPGDKEVKRIMEENEDIKEAGEELERISQDERIRREVLNAEIARRDNEQRMYEAKRNGREEGLVTGRKEGKIEGRKEAKLEDAKKMLEKKIPIETIVEITGLTKDESKLSRYEIDFMRKNYIPRDSKFGIRAFARNTGLSSSHITRIIHGEKCKLEHFDSSAIKDGWCVCPKCGTRLFEVPDFSYIEHWKYKCDNPECGYEFEINTPVLDRYIVNHNT